jgi:uncharacterized YigZ family protein
VSAARETLAAPAQALLEVKKSRHVARAARVDSPEAAMAFIAEVAREPATHHCWAWRIGQAYRFNDDGEPAGTAGKPILAAIDGQGLDHVVVVVTRWFGGVKLGAGGLVRAYGGAAAEALRQAPRQPLITLERIAVRVGFAHAQVLHALLAEFNARKAAEHFDAEGLRVELDLPVDAIDALETRLLDATRGLSQVYRER